MQAGMSLYVVIKGFLFFSDHCGRLHDGGLPFQNYKIPCVWSLACVAATWKPYGDQSLCVKCKLHGTLVDMFFDFL